MVIDAEPVVEEAEGLRLHLSDTNITGYMGVHDRRRTGYRGESQFFYAVHCKEGRNKRLGTFDTAVAAAVAYAKFCRRMEERLAQRRAAGRGEEQDEEEEAEEEEEGEGSGEKAEEEGGEEEEVVDEAAKAVEAANAAEAAAQAAEAKAAAAEAATATAKEAAAATAKVIRLDYFYCGRIGGWGSRRNGGGEAEEAEAAEAKKGRWLPARDGATRPLLLPDVSRRDPVR